MVKHFQFVYQTSTSFERRQHTDLVKQNEFSQLQSNNNFLLKQKILQQTC